MVHQNRTLIVFCIYDCQSGFYGRIKLIETLLQTDPIYLHNFSVCVEKLFVQNPAAFHDRPA